MSLIFSLIVIAIGTYFVLRKSRENWRREAEALFQADTVMRSGFVDIKHSTGTTKLHYLQGGVGPDLVLLHGIGANARIWQRLSPLLTHRYRVTAFDLPGFGLSEKNDSQNQTLDEISHALEQGIQALKLEPRAFVGSSMGGNIALWLATRQSRKLAHPIPKVVALAPAADPELIPEPILKWIEKLDFLKYLLTPQTMSLILSHRILFDKKLVRRPLVLRYLYPFLIDRGTLKMMLRSRHVISDPRVPEAYGDIASEVLMIYGEHDKMVPKNSHDHVAKSLKNVRSLTYFEAGHHLMEDQPKWLAQQIDEFLSESKSSETRS